MLPHSAAFSSAVFEIFPEFSFSYFKGNAIAIRVLIFTMRSPFEHLVDLTDTGISTVRREINPE